MARTPSTMSPLGTKAPSFALPDVVDGRIVRLADFDAKGTLLVMFVCRHCPYVVHVADQLARLGRDYREKDVAIVAISSNDAVAYPDDAPPRLAEFAKERGFTFPFLHDATQEVARAYQAACTPDFFVFDRGRSLVYRGQLDESRPNSGIPVTGKDLRAALDRLLAGDLPDTDQKPSLGCNIKWKA